MADADNAQTMQKKNASPWLKPVVGVCALLIVFGLGMYWAVTTWYQNAITAPHIGGAGAKSFSIEPGEPMQSVAMRLESEGFVKAADVVYLYLFMSGKDADIQAGEYTLTQNLSVVQVIDALKDGTFDASVTLLEGWRTEEMAEHVRAWKEELTERDVTGTAGWSYEKAFLEAAKGSEGYLFPDTYRVPRDITAEELVELMKETFDARYGELDTKTSQLTKDEIVTIASLVEREVREDSDRKRVAGIIIKRLQNDWLLQIDATIQYALGLQESSGDWWKASLTVEDVKLRSPYNTYIHTGLPPTPICNPGLASLAAALKPEKSEYWYYLSDTEGTIHYARTLAEHNQNIHTYLGL